MKSLGTSEGLSIIIPTFNERDNVEPLVHRLARVRERWGQELEILIIDDHSPDGTGRHAQRLASAMNLPVRVVDRVGPRSLGRAIVEGINLSHGELVCIMDADLSHPPELILDLLQALDGADGVVASRYVTGGSIARWTRARRVVSWGATALSRPLIRTPCRDPLSGFFLFRRASLAGLSLTGIGNKPLLEILAQKPFTIHEIPYEFHDRERGSSKLGPRGLLGFTRLLARLAGRSIRGDSPGFAYEREAPTDARQP